MRSQKLVMAGAILLGAISLSGQLPEISFTFVPPQGSDANLTGEVMNVNPEDHRVAVYIYVHGWWTKPTNAQPLSMIDSGGNWVCDITTGGADLVAKKIAAFLIPVGYDPPILNGTAEFPVDLQVTALASIQVDRQSVNAFHFSGYDWDVKTSGGFLFGPGPNVFSDDLENVWVDAEGKLHLRITYRDGQWRCAEVISNDSFGYGTYRFYVDSPVDALDPNVVLGLFTWSDDPAYSYREIDVEITRWGDAQDPTNAQFVVQPWNNPGNLVRYTIPQGSAPTTHSFDWQADQIAFASHDGAYAPPPDVTPLLTQWTYTGPDIPVPGDEQVRINLWLVSGLEPIDGEEVEVVISRFVFIPSVVPPPKLTFLEMDDQGNLQLSYAGIPQLLYNLQSSPDLDQWTKVQSQISDEATFQFSAPSPSVSEKVFYRVQVPVQ
ncbi:glycoside hydrolase family 16 protein [Puniceicoccales bacterium CK1056]|uniref:Glycoside hydrolase family 16 protein n=1 Tax=Oceanipulchritudo coccoides TaxID=2706888 RepID=A0A6B2M1F2_9BACT|nr:glycoside hydrolase family 16 protein [Oceanipulchritudo coccoides]NDV61907.1 glycoside hydrolase family 16 protein [Oceanipulchritudo coccoides]